MLNDRQRRFVEQYLVDLNATQAAIRSGYSVATASEQASRLLANVKVAAAIAEAQAARSRRTEVTADRVVLELARIAFSDSRRVMSWGPGGVTLRDSAALTEEEAAIVAEASQTVTEAGGTIRLKTVDKLGALRLLAQHLGMLGEGKVAVTVATSPAVGELQAVLLRVLDRHPDAKRAVVAALEAVAAEDVAGHAGRRPRPPPPARPRRPRPRPFWVRGPPGGRRG